MTVEQQITKDWNDLLDRFHLVANEIDKELLECQTMDEFKKKEEEIEARFYVEGLKRSNPCSLSFLLIRHEQRIKKLDDK